MSIFRQTPPLFVIATLLATGSAQTYLSPAETFSAPTPTGWQEERIEEVVRFTHAEAEGEMILVALEGEEDAALVTALQDHIDEELDGAFMESPLQLIPVPLPSGTWTQRIYQHGEDLLAVISLEHEGVVYVVIARGTQAAFMQAINAAANQVLAGFGIVGTVEEDLPEEAGASEAASLEIETGILHGTLQLPEGAGPFPVALIIAGSGPTDRDGNSAVIPGQNNSLRMLAEGLAVQGIASLRYDKRGVAASAAAAVDEADIAFEDFVGDAALWLERLREDERFSKLVVIGHSEGSLIGMLAAQRVGADAFVSLAGPGQSAADLLLVQLAAQLPAPLLEEAQAAIGELREGREVGEVSPELLVLFRPSVQPYLISWFRYDPAEVIARLEMPVLIVQGTSDIQVAVAEAERLAAAQPQAELVLIEDMNHVLKEVPAGQAEPLQSYGDPTLPLAPGLLEAITGFLTE